MLPTLVPQSPAGAAARADGHHTPDEQESVDLAAAPNTGAAIQGALPLTPIGGAVPGPDRGQSTSSARLAGVPLFAPLGPCQLRGHA